MEIILLIIITLFSLGGFLLHAKNFIEARKRIKMLEAAYEQEDFDEEMGVEFEPEEGLPIFIKLPMELRNYGKENIREQNKCQECADKAERLSLPMNVVCPELNCDDDEEPKGNYEIVPTFDYVRPHEIKNFYSIDDKTTNVSFYNGETFRYNISEKALLEKLSPFIHIV